eukprot:jgi/Chlat1/379/Chrsp10S01489
MRSGVILIVVLLAAVCVQEVAAASKKARLREKDLVALRTACEERVSGVEACLESAAARENCVLKCASPSCYDKVYASDPLEDGEIDSERGRAFRACARMELRTRMVELERTT